MRTRMCVCDGYRTCGCACGFLPLWLRSVPLAHICGSLVFFLFIFFKQHIPPQTQQHRTELGQVVAPAAPRHPPAEPRRQRADQPGLVRFWLFWCMCIESRRSIFLYFRGHASANQTNTHPNQTTHPPTDNDRHAAHNGHVVRGRLDWYSPPVKVVVKRKAVAAPASAVEEKKK